LVVSELALWAVTFLPARYFGGTPAVAYSAVALALTLVPAVVVLVLAGSLDGSSPQQTTLIVFGGTGLRMVFVLGGGLLVYTQVPYFRQISFWIWLLVFYLYTLTVEVLLLRQKPVRDAH
jgi:hypothetical protein